MKVAKKDHVEYQLERMRGICVKEGIRFDGEIAMGAIDVCDPAWYGALLPGVSRFFEAHERWCTHEFEDHYCQWLEWSGREDDEGDDSNDEGDAVDDIESGFGIFQTDHTMDNMDFSPQENHTWVNDDGLTITETP